MIDASKKIIITQEELKMESLAVLSAAGGILSIIGSIAKPLLILLVGNIAIKMLLKVVRGLMNKTTLDEGIKGFTLTAARIALWALVIITVVDALGIDTTSLVAIVSVVSLALSLAFQNIMTNVFSGIIILISKPFVVGDYVDAAGVSGTVRAISIMRTTLVTPDNKVQLVPNGDIEIKNITNYSSESMRRVDMKVSASYDASTDTVKAAIMEIINRDERIIKDDEMMTPFVRLNAYNSNDIEYIIRVWTTNGEYWNVYFDTMEAIRESFAKHEIEFSYPHTVVHMTK